ncbi:MAG TPA: hypothetical protein ENK99_00125 [Campylobacterales bacterium]|nr:hypothetical protein [Campylobacterales bacterium]
MNTKVFISGSIAIKFLPMEVSILINKIIAQGFNILVGDADGVDLSVQRYCLSKEYFNVVIYHISEKPRNLATDKFKVRRVNVPDSLKKERERQMYKDKEMTIDSDFSLIIWDGKSKGSYANIIRALEQNKKVNVYSMQENKFLEPNKLNKLNIEYIFRENNGYSASEVVSYLQNNGTERFKRPQDLNKYLFKRAIIKKEGKIYSPMPGYSDLFIVKKYRGKKNGINFRNEFIDWIEKDLKATEEAKLTQDELFAVT